MVDDELFYVGQKAMIEDGGNVLLLNDPLLGNDLPGGKVQEGETNFAEALKREVIEETGLEVEVGDPFSNGYFQYPVIKGHRNSGKKIYLIVFRCKLLSGTLTLSSEHDGYRWISKKDYKKYVTKEWILKTVDKYFKHYSS
jgi:8-oxo-dGTP diphosphatase